jgi:protein subunit release factor A
MREASIGAFFVSPARLYKELVKDRERAMKMLRAKLYERMVEQQVGDVAA